jgi:hypothetical protein
MLVFFGSTDDKYVLIDGDLETSVRVNGKAIFRIGEEGNSLYLNYTYHDEIGCWGAEVVPTGDYCDALVSMHVDGNNPVVEVESDHKIVHHWDTELKQWIELESQARQFDGQEEEEGGFKVEIEPYEGF